MLDIHSLSSLYEAMPTTEKYYFSNVVQALLDGRNPMDILYGLLSGKEIVDLNLVSPKVDTKQVAQYSFGPDPYGYTLRLGAEYIQDGVTQTSDTIIVPSKEFILVSTLEKLHIPEDITGVLQGKSSYIRQGVFFNFGIIDAGFHNANLSFPIFNASKHDIELKIGEGIAQMILFRSAHKATDKYNGKYSNRNGVVQL